MNLSIIITTRHDPLLRWTIDNIRRTVGGEPQIVVVFDGCQEESIEGVVSLRNENPLGVQRSRDIGIYAAGRDNVVVMDAHMNFREGSNWGRAIIDHLTAHPKDVCCGWCTHLEDGALTMPELQKDDSGRPMYHYAGCDIQAFCFEPGEQFIPLMGKWRRWSKEPGEIACIMGGLYAMRRDWYLSGLATPWELGTSWGGDEETISAVNWICGGRNMLVPVEAGHVFRAKSVYKVDIVRDHVGVWANRIRPIEMLPMSAGLYGRLLEHVRKTDIVRREDSRIERAINITAANAKRAHYEQHGRQLDDYLKRWGAL